MEKYASIENVGRIECAGPTDLSEDVTRFRSIDEYVECRNSLQLRAENINEQAAQECWRMLGVANRHLERLAAGRLTLVRGVTDEIDACLRRTREWLDSRSTTAEDTAP